MKAKLNEIIKHGHLGIIAAFFAIYMVTFSYIENRDVHHYIVHTVLDEKIPFCEYFIIPYLLWFIFVAVTVLYFMFFNQNKWKEYYQLMITLGIGMTLFLVISLVFPNGQDLRPVLSGNSIFIQAVQFIYHTDTPTNVLPSIHVYNSLAAFMAIKRSKLARKQKGWAWGTGILTVLIILATVFLKQHSMFDGVCALALYVVTDKLCYGVNPETERSKVRNQLI